MRIVDAIAARAGRLSALEKERAELVFAAILPTESIGWAPFASMDRGAFWRALEETSAPSFGPGLRLMLGAITYLPVADRRFGAPFHRLEPSRRIDFVESLAADERYPVRQLLTTMKMLACLACFDDAGVRARFPEAR